MIIETTYALTTSLRDELLETVYMTISADRFLDIYDKREITRIFNAPGVYLLFLGALTLNDCNLKIEYTYDDDYIRTYYKEKVMGYNKKILSIVSALQLYNCMSSGF